MTQMNLSVKQTYREQTSGCQGGGGQEEEVQTTRQEGSRSSKKLGKAQYAKQKEHLPEDSLCAKF